MRIRYSVFLSSILVIINLNPGITAQQLGKNERESAKLMLQTIASDIKKHYYDPKFHGLDWDAVVAETSRKIDNSANFGVAMVHIGAAVDALNDSHTRLLPPRTMTNLPHGWVSNWRARMLLPNVRHDYGWEYALIGERCFVTHVRPGSDAEKKGLHAGDEILSINDYRPERGTIQKAEYVFNVLLPQDELRLEVLNPAGVKSHLVVAAKVREVGLVSQYMQSAAAIRAYEEREHLLQPQVEEFGDDLLIIKLPAFYPPPDQVERLIGKARKHKALIFDLRDNHGGREDTLQKLLGGIFDHEVKIGDKIMRSGQKPLTATPLHKTFEGKIMVLVDSRSASAAEIFTRVVQIEKRGTVLGDRSAGRVMEANFYPYRLFGDAVFYGVYITEADLIMNDGKSLEHVGVTPDEIMIPSASDLTQGRDPVLAHAAETLGVKLSPEQAGKLFPYEWPPE